MLVRRLRRYVIVPIVYLGIIAGLLYVQLSGTLTVHHNIGDLEFVGTLKSGEDKTSSLITEAQITFHGFQFNLGPENPLLLATQERRDMRLRPVRFRLEDDSLQIVMEDESYVQFQVTKNQSGELHIVPHPAETWTADATLVVPFGLKEDVHPDTESLSSPEALLVRSDEDAYVLSTPPRTAIDLAQRHLLVPMEATSQLIRIAQLGSRELNVVETAFGAGQRQVDHQFYQDTIASYFDLAYRSWAGSRYNGGSGTWDMRDGSPRFSEEILTAYLAEAWRRDEYTIAINQMRRAADLHDEQVGLLSAPFLGNLRTITPRFVEEDRQRTEDLLSRTLSRDTSVWTQSGIMEFAALRGSRRLYEELLRFSEFIDYRAVDLETAVGMLENAVAGPHPTEESRETLDRFLQIIEEQIFPAVVQFDQYFGLVYAPGEIDVKLSIRAGYLVERVGMQRGNQLYTTVGRNLVLSGLQLADDRGFLPRRLFVDQNGVQNREGSFGPEELYALFIDNPSYPHAISLFGDLGPGSFVWTIVDFPSVAVEPNQHVYELKYPFNRTHFIIMHGIPPFESMELFGLTWRNDPVFESYVKGRHYDPETETLMIKYTDDSTSGRIVLEY